MIEPIELRMRQKLVWSRRQSCFCSEMSVGRERQIDLAQQSVFAQSELSQMSEETRE